MPYIVGNRRQSLLLPSCVDDYIGTTDPVRVYDAFVEQLDFAELGIELDLHRVGPPEFDPHAMLKLLVYGYSYGVRSSRKLERATHHNLSFIWLLGGLKPDHKTIARFRRTHCEALKNVLRQCARLCVKLGLIEGNTLFVDGTKIRANASMKNTWTAARCEQALREVDRRIDAILAECEEADSTEEEHASLVTPRRELQDQQQLKQRLEDVLEELREGKTATNTTDPQAGRFRSGAQIEVGYNCQAVVDDRHGLIVHTEVVNQSNDVGLFSDQISHAHDTLGKTCRTACADAGFCSPEDLKKTLDQGVDVVVPIVRHSDFRDKFAYEPERDRYRCPEGHPLKYIGDHKDHRTRIYQIADSAICGNCSAFGTCTRAKQGRRVERPYTESVREQLERRSREADAQALMRRRKLRAEHPFGHIKHNLGMRAFLLRGLSGVRAEAGLAATSFNLARMISLMGATALLRSFAPTS